MIACNLHDAPRATPRRPGAMLVGGTSIGTTPGIYTTFQFMVAFIDWATNRRSLTAQDIVDRWGVGRATAYRWLSAYKNARGET